MDGAVRPVPGLRRKAVLAILALRVREIVSADRLVDAVWSGEAPPGASSTVQSHMSYLRRVFGRRDVIVARSPGYVLDLARDATDTEVAERLIDLARTTHDRSLAVSSLRAALALWRDESLVDVRGVPWLAEQAQRLDQVRHTAVRALTDARLALGEHAEVLPEIEQLAARHPFDEAVHRQLMLALHRAGRHVDALAAYHRVRVALRDELGMDPGPALRDLQTAILRQDPALDPPAPSVVRTSTAVRPGPRWRGGRALPPARTALIGRDHDLGALEHLLRTHRVVTVTGPGGVGKSTVALRLARDALDAQGGEVVFAELAPVRDRMGVARAVAEAAGIEGAGPDDVATLAAALGPRRLLLVLDNCEHVLDATAELLDAVLDAGSGARVLATSREPLGVDGEGVHVLGSLGQAAATLFVERAAAATGVRGMTAGDPQVVELCEHLDGLPLAIELAAAQLRHLTLADLMARLDQRLGILVGGRPRAGPRHATLAATIEWSYRLLSDTSRELFDRLGVFPASFDLTAVHAVGAGLDPVLATNALGDLVAKSLVAKDPAGAGRTGRYRLLETIRLFAADRLQRRGETAAATEALRRHLVARATTETRSGCWLSASLAARNRVDIENVRVAFAACLAGGWLTDAVDLMIGLSSLWRNASAYAEGQAWAAQLKRLALAPRDRLWLHVVEADLGLGSGNPRLMGDAAARAGQLAAEVNDPAAAVIAAIYQSLLAIREPQRAIAGLRAARDRAGRLDTPHLHRLARGFLVVALLAAGRRPDPAEIAELTAPTGDGYDRYICTWAAWLDALADGDGPALRRRMDTQVAGVRASGLEENWLMAFSQALTAIGEGSDYQPHLLRARQRAAAEGRQADIDCVLALAYAAACGDEPVRAAELIGASSTGLFHDTANFPLHMIIRDRLVRPRLDTATFDDAITRGMAQPIGAILARHHL